MYSYIGYNNILYFFERKVGKFGRKAERTLGI
jgi:hypothetical protein